VNQWNASFISILLPPPPPPLLLLLLLLLLLQVQGAAFALQLGVDALLLSPPPHDSNDDIWEVARIAQEQKAQASPPVPESQGVKVRR